MFLQINATQTKYSQHEQTNKKMRQKEEEDKIDKTSNKQTGWSVPQSPCSICVIFKYNRQRIMFESVQAMYVKGKIQPNVTFLKDVLHAPVGAYKADLLILQKNGGLQWFGHKSGDNCNPLHCNVSL